MGLSPEDFKWLDAKIASMSSDLGERLESQIGTVHDRITSNKEEIGRQINMYRNEVMEAQEKCESRTTRIADDLQEHVSRGCPAIMERHIEDKHNAAKFLGLIALASGVAVGALKLLMWLFSVKDTVPW